MRQGHLIGQAARKQWIVVGHRRVPLCEDVPTGTRVIAVRPTLRSRALDRSRFARRLPSTADAAGEATPGLVKTVDEDWEEAPTAARVQGRRFSAANLVWPLADWRRHSRGSLGNGPAPRVAACRISSYKALSSAAFCSTRCLGARWPEPLVEPRAILPHLVTLRRRRMPPAC